MEYEKQPTICPFCGNQVILEKNNKIPSGWCYVCKNCGAMVGTLPKEPNVAMGVLATTQTRAKRRELHKLFDQLWSGHEQRAIVYEQLAKEMGMDLDSCHFALMNDTQLDLAREIIMRMWREKYDR